MLLCYPRNDAGSRTGWVLGWGRRTGGVHGVVFGSTKQATEQTNCRRGPRGEEQEDRGWKRDSEASECLFFFRKQFHRKIHSQCLGLALSVRS